MITALLLALSVAATPPQAYATASAACAAFPIRSTGTTYYFCDCGIGARTGCAANQGNDANPCTSSGAPCRSLDRMLAIFGSMNGGDTVAFCQGGAWDRGTPVAWGSANPRCTAAANMRTAANTTTCDIRDYPTAWGGSQKPILRATGTNILLNFSDVWQDGVRVLNLDFQGGGTNNGSGSDGAFAGVLNSQSHDFLICNNTFNGWYLGVYSAFEYGSRRPANIDIWGNSFTYCSLDAFLGGGPNFTIEANYIQDNGGSNNQTHTIYPQATTAVPGSMNIKDNDIRFINRSCGSIVISGHGAFSSVNIENNWLIATNASQGCWGFGMAPDSGYGTPEFNRNVTIHRNYLDVNDGWYMLWCGGCANAIIENNVVIYRNPSSNARSAICAPNTNANVGLGDDITTNVRLRNNTVYQTGGSGGGLTGIAVPCLNGETVNQEGSGYVISNNVVRVLGSTQCWTMTWAGGIAAVTNNACSTGVWDTTPVAATNTVTTNPAGWFSGTPGTPPTLTTLVPAVGSPLLGAGSTTSTYFAIADLNGTTRPSPPAIGAYEIGAPSGVGSLSTPTSAVHGAPRFSLSGDTTQVILSTILSGARIYFCTGTAACTPSRTTTTQYTTPLTVPSGQTVCARAWKGEKRYPTACSTYTVN